MLTPYDIPGIPGNHHMLPPGVGDFSLDRLFSDAPSEPVRPF
jgi:hypothetical protein